MNESKLVKEGKMSTPEEVAKDGDEALMAGKDKVISGMQNKVQVAMSNITPDENVAEMMHKKQAPSDE